MIRMGVDASTSQTGWCIFNDNKLIKYGKISPDSEDYSWREKIIYMMNEIIIIAKQHNVEQIATEVPVKTMQNTVTLERLFTLQGAIMGMSIASGISFIPVEVNYWRKKIGLLKDIPKSIKDKRAVLKERSIKMANDLYGLNLVWKSPSSKFNDDDISDAILICHTIVNEL